MSEGGDGKMPRIIPIRDLRDTNKITEMCSDSPEPIFVTKNGISDLVILSSEKYDSLCKNNNYSYKILLNNYIIERAM